MQFAILPNWWLQDEEGSTLTINNVSVSDSGNYSCQPRDLRADEVMVTILSERQAPDALQDKTTHSGDSASSLRQNYLGNWGRPTSKLTNNLTATQNPTCKYWSVNQHLMDFLKI